VQGFHYAPPLPIYEKNSLGRKSSLQDAVKCLGKPEPAILGASPEAYVILALEKHPPNTVIGSTQSADQTHWRIGAEVPDTGGFWAPARRGIAVASPARATRR
jgi:hypothetical protein